MLPVGTLIAGYRIRGVLGSGGMGTVYAADDPHLPRVDALKLLPTELSGDPKYRGRFLREAEVAASLDHPNIVSIYDRGETADGHLWIAMQLVEGTDAQAEIRAGAMTPDRAVRIVGEIGKALDYSHAQNLLHRDVKPANMLLSGNSGPEERVLLADFGVARFADDSHRTATHEMVATFAYSAPEILEGRPADGRADLYSLGCSLFEMLTGRAPFEDAQGVAGQAMAHLRRPPPAVTAAAPWLPPAFDAVIAKAMAKDPNQRYSSGAELASDAYGALRQLPQQPAPPPAGSARSGRTLLIAGVVTALVATAGAVLYVTSRGSGPRTAVSDSSTTAAPVADDAVDPLLRSPDQLARFLGGKVPAKAEEYKAPLIDSSYKDPLCVGALFPIEQNSYKNTSAGRITGQNLDAKEAGAVAQAVIVFPSADTAQEFVTRQTTVWPGCVNKDIEISGDDKVVWRTFDWQDRDGMLTMSSQKVDSPNICQHALTSRNNVVIDVLACIPQAAGKNDAAAAIAGEIADAVPR